MDMQICRSRERGCGVEEVSGHRHILGREGMKYEPTVACTRNVR